MTRDELRAWLRESAPADLAEVVRVAVDCLASESWGAHQHWCFEAGRIIDKEWANRPPGVDKEAVYAELWRIKELREIDAKNAEEADKQRRERLLKVREKRRLDEARRARAEVARLEAIKERHAKQVKSVAKRFGCTLRNAQMVLRDGVRDYARAEKLAKLLGGDAAYYFRRAAKPGREPDPVTPFMRIRPHGVSLREFADDDIELDGVARESLHRLYPVLWECETLEHLLALARGHEVNSETAQLIWLEYKRWRIRVISERAEAKVADEIARFYDFG